MEAIVPVPVSRWPVRNQIANRFDHHLRPQRRAGGRFDLGQKAAAMPRFAGDRGLSRGPKQSTPARERVPYARCLPAPAPWDGNGPGVEGLGNRSPEPRACLLTAIEPKEGSPKPIS
jgi:hypothetical protein